MTTKKRGDARDAKDLRRILRGWDVAPARLATGAQVHGTRIVQARPRDGGRRFPKTDALVSTHPGVALGIFTADCAPVFLVDRLGRGVALVHAGWRGVVKRIVPGAVQKLKQKGIVPRDVVAVLGPHIGVCCYQVGWDVARFFPSRWRNRENGKTFRVSMSGWIAQQLKGAGVSGRRVVHRAPCTVCDKRFHSYRREKTDQRMLSCVMLKGASLRRRWR